MHHGSHLPLRRHEILHRPRENTQAEDERLFLGQATVRDDSIAEIDSQRQY